MRKKTALSDSKTRATTEPENQVVSVPDPDLPKKRGRPLGSKNKVKISRPDRTEQTETGENSKFMIHAMKLINLPSIDINNPQAVQERVNQYFSLCAEDDIRPSVASLAQAFGVNRFMLFDWLNRRNKGITNQDSFLSLKKAYDTINSYYEFLMNTGKINPVSGIFLMKNNLGYKDTTDYVISTDNGNNVTVQDIETRAGLLSE